MEEEERSTKRRRVLSDVTLLLTTSSSTQEYKAVRHALCVASKFFDELFLSEHYKEEKSPLIQIPDNSEDAMITLLDAMHCETTFVSVTEQTWSFCLKV